VFTGALCTAPQFINAKLQKKWQSASAFGLLFNYSGVCATLFLVFIATFDNFAQDYTINSRM